MFHQNLLAIETSCDETAISLLQVKRNAEGDVLSLCVLAHEVHSQFESHKPFGGVVPEVAARDHLAKIHELAQLALHNSALKISEVTSVAVTLGPGLIGALMVGVLFARGLALSLNVPLIAVNHVDAHLAPVFLLPHFSLQENIGKWHSVTLPKFPALALTVSGGHCHLSYFHSLYEKKILGKSLDDACGEAFDKTAKLLGLAYPGGAFIEALALVAEQEGNTSAFSFPFKLANKDNRYSFSYSGLKTAVVEAVRQETGVTKGKVTGENLSLSLKQALSYAFQYAALMQLFDRVSNALQDYPEVNSIFVAGGVAQNNKFREIFARFKKQFHKEIIFAPPALCSDNATMIGLQAMLNENQDGFVQQPYSKYTHQN